MSPVDAHELLKGLSSLLGESGQVKGAEEIGRITSLMKEANKLVSRCVYINILKVTVDKDVLNKFIEAGGWEVLNTWLKEAKSSDNSSFLVEILKVYQQLPVSVDLLKQNSCAKTIKQISKSEDESLKTLSANIVDKWMQKIKEKSSSSSQPSDKSKKKKKHKDEKEERSPSGKSHSKSEHNKKDKNVSKDSSSVKSEDIKITEKTEESNNSNHVKKDRPKTVKTAPSKFRSTGLEQPTSLPPKKKTADSEKSQAVIKRPSVSIKIAEPPEKKTRSSLPSPVNPLLKTTNTTEVSLLDKIKGNMSTETRGKIKIIPARPRPVQDVQESSEFMKSLNAAHSPGVIKRKRKLSAQPNQKPTSPTSPSPKVPSFYRDTLDTNETKDESAMSPVQNGDPADSAEKNGVTQDVEMKDETSEEKESEEKKEEDKESIASSESSSSKDPKKKKKRVSWVEDHKLKIIHYFELDETERVNVNKLKDFQEMQKEEMMLDRQAMQTVKRLSADNMQEAIAWRRPSVIDNLPVGVEHGCNSQEKETQRQRQAVVLAAIFFTKEMIPDSALDPEPEPFEPAEPKIIPLEDTTGTATEYVQTAPAPPPVTTTESVDLAQLSISPDLARLVNSMQQDHPDKGTQMSVGSVSSNVQNLLSKLMTNNTNQHSDDVAENLKRILDPFTGQVLEGPVHPPPNMQGPPVNSLLGVHPPGFPPPMMGPGGRGMVPPRGPPPPNFRGAFPPGPRPEGMEDWGENMQGGPMIRGRGRAGMPMRGGRGMAPPPMRGMGARGRGTRPLCRHFASPTGCKRGMSCAFLHPGVNAPPL